MPTTFHVPLDDALTTVAVAHSPASGTIVVADGSVFGSSFPVLLVAYRDYGLESQSLLTLLGFTGRSGNTLTGVTAIAGRSDVTLNVGDTVFSGPTALAMTEVHAAVNAAEATIATHTSTLASHAATLAGLGSVDNTSDAGKPVSTAQATALALKAPLASPALTGNPTVPTQTPGTNNTRIASTAYVDAAAAALLNGAGAAYDTLKELQDLIVADESGVSALTTTVAGKLAKASNLSDLTNVVTARLNLGLVIGTDVLSPSGVGTSLTALNATNLTSGTVATARLGSGTASSSTYLRGDQTWATIAAGGGVSIGDAIGGGTAGRVLYEGAGPVLAHSASLAYDGSALTVNGILAASDGQQLGGSSSQRFLITAYGIGDGNLSTTPGEFRWGAGSSSTTIQGGYLSLGSGVVLRWSSGSPTSAPCDVAFVRGSPGVIKVTDGGAGGGALAMGSSATGSRPTVTTVGAQWFDTTLTKPVFWDGTNWRDAAGTIV